ncbi:MAG: molybdopterin molybdotransferase MoeA [Kiritimatiellae bacterium]|nr:molybdopterin molybdotransferase MoeA [Kiritimatiellia bacterium]
MIPFEQAYETAMANVHRLPAEAVGLSDALGRILAEDVTSDMDMPPFDKSAMDGYACRREDLGAELTVLETVPAGRPPTRAIGKGECSKIMTGAMVPEGADCVVMVEYTERPAPHTMRFTGGRTADNICLKGEDVRAGSVVLRRGDRIEPQHIAVLASVGCTRPSVARRPRVGVIATGSELVEPDARPGACQIRNSNGYQLCAQVRAMGAVPDYGGIAGDTESETDAAVKAAMAANDVILLSGGVSEGEFDLVRAILKDNGFELLFEKVAVKPGKPTVFGWMAESFCFGLPGNPVSTFVLFEILVKPFLFAMMGHDYRPMTVRLPLAEPVRRKKTERASWIPVVVRDSRVSPVGYHGSAHVHALCRADGLICIPLGVAELPEGSPVDVRQI